MIMTREEQIRRASIEYTLKNRPKCICGDMEDELNRNPSFEEGAKWADMHPVNVLHDANEKPRTKEWLLVHFDEDDYDTIYLYIDIWCDWCKTFNVIQWAYISEMLPKGGEK